jgi:hypothetical protein
VSKLRFKISMSVDGFVAGPHQSVDNPLGIGGARLHEWAFQLAIFREMHGQDGGEVNASTPVVSEMLANIGATVMGRNMFGGHPGKWKAENAWNGWWGEQSAVPSPSVRAHSLCTKTAAFRRGNNLHVRDRRRRSGARAGTTSRWHKRTSLSPVERTSPVSTFVRALWMRWKLVSCRPC